MKNILIIISFQLSLLSRASYLTDALSMPNLYHKAWCSYSSSEHRRLSGSLTDRALCSTAVV